MIPCRIIYIIIVVIFTSVSCGNHQKQQQVMQSKKQMTAKNILGNSDYLAISYGVTEKIQERYNQPLKS